MSVKLVIYGLVTLILLAALPPAVVAKLRSDRSDKRRIHLIQDMDNQNRIGAQDPSPMVMLRGEDATVPLFADERGMRPQIEGTVARGELFGDDHFDRGFTMASGGPEWVTAFPDRIVVDEDFIRRGEERYNIYCTPCHGVSGYGDGIVHQRANKLMLAGINGTTWVQPKNLHEEAIRAQPIGQIYNSITNGVRNMAGYESQIPTRDRWAIVAWVKTLQRSQHAEPSDLSATSFATLETVTTTVEVEEAAGSADGS